MVCVHDTCMVHARRKHLGEAMVYAWYMHMHGTHLGEAHPLECLVVLAEVAARAAPLVGRADVQRGHAGRLARRAHLFVESTHHQPPHAVMAQGAHPVEDEGQERGGAEGDEEIGSAEGRAQVGHAALPHHGRQSAELGITHIGSGPEAWRPVLQPRPQRRQGVHLA